MHRAMPSVPRPSHAERRRRIQSSSSPLLAPTSTSTSSPSPRSSPPLPPSTTIILVHGLGRTRRSMARLATRLERSTGLRAVSIGYPSRKLSVADAAKFVSRRAAEACGGAGRPAFAVTFSLGGPIIRHASLLGEDGSSSNGSSGSGNGSNGSNSSSGGGGPRWLGSVLLAPPNRGSDLARELLFSSPAIVGRVFRFLYGPAVFDLASAPEAIAREWPDAPRPCGVIAGTAPRSLNPASLLLASRVFGGGGGGGAAGGSERGKEQGGKEDERRRPARAHDGTVAVDETSLPIPADDFATVHAGHTLIADSKETAELVAAFLKSGRFS